MATHSYTNVIVQKEPKHKVLLGVTATAESTELSTNDDVIIVEDDDRKIAAVPVTLTTERHKMFACHLCPKKFSHKSNLYTHRKVHDPMREIYPCTVCGSNFLYKCSLKVHMLNHSKDKIFKCRTCGDVLKNEALLKLHEAVKHASHSCEFCAKVFATKSSLLAHKRLHDDKGCTCQICFRSFKYRNHLLLHMRTHNYDSAKSAGGCQPKEVENSETLQNEPTQAQEPKPKVPNTENAPLAHTDQQKTFNIKKDIYHAIGNILQTNTSNYQGINHFNIGKILFSPNVTVKNIQNNSNSVFVSVNNKNIKTPTQDTSSNKNDGKKLKEVEQKQEETNPPLVIKTEPTETNDAIVQSSEKLSLVPVFQRPKVLGVKNFKEMVEKHTPPIIICHVCEICNISFSSKEFLDDHISEKHSCFNCVVCHREFKHKAYLNIHKLTHTGNYKVVCQHCQKGFAFQSRLNLHMARCHQT